MVAVAEDGGMGEDDVVEVGVLISSSLCPCGDVANIAKRSRERERWMCFNDPKAIVQISTPALSTRFSHVRVRAHLRMSSRSRSSYRNSFSLKSGSCEESM